MDPTETSSNPDDAAGESAASAELSAAEPEISIEPALAATTTEHTAEASGPDPAPADSHAASDGNDGNDGNDPVAGTGAESAIAAEPPIPSAEPTDADPTKDAGAGGEAVASDGPGPTEPAPGNDREGEVTAADDAAPSPEVQARPARIISSSGAPGAPTVPTARVPDQGAIPPPPGLGSAPGASAPAPSLGEIRGLRSGQIIEGRVTAVDANEAVLEMDDGSAGVIGKRHLSANGQTVPTDLLSVGDRVEAAVLVRDDPKGRLVLSRAWALKQRAWEIVEAAKATNKPLTGRVTGLVKGGLVVDVGTRAFLPASQIDLQHVDDLAAFVGQDIEALVHEADRINDKVVLSRRNLLRQAQRAKANEVVSTLAPGQVHKGRVSLLTDFGAFVEIGGVRGLVHLSEISWARVDRAADVLSPGDEIDVKVLAIKPGKKLSLSIRALSQDPLAGLETGQVLSGVVTRLADFGAFVRVGDGAEGLVHVTELAEYRVHAPEEVVTPGDEVLVKVLRIDRKRRRLDLSVNQAVLT